MKLILNYLKPYRSRVTLGVIIKFLGTMMELVLPWNLAYILDHVIPQKDPKKILFWGGVMLAASAFSLCNIGHLQYSFDPWCYAAYGNSRADPFGRRNLDYYYLRSDFDFSFSGSDADHLCNGDAYLEKGRALIWKIAKAS